MILYGYSSDSLFRVARGILSGISLDALGFVWKVFSLIRASVHLLRQVFRRLFLEFLKALKNILDLLMFVYRFCVTKMVSKTTENQRKSKSDAKWVAE